ncbi:TPA: primase C-terminal domain-containing protein [Streptococcus suis]|nr:primase C-terminal domain-containing protein [Streptococcus suis]HEM3626848.1 primase C-terminal domain-containing protein [Streptococcus suis]HEM3653549.1 primase C-terminal domain-containing protein [Streptococcus suis]HEM3656961.1 primase C-terminal domain-containing protein [Streptococcus suis]HEM3700477.1 primase C-terminal domain-containing protein [Streptococcus suis]
MNLNNVYRLILKEGLRNYKFRNSHLKPVPSAEEGKRGAIFAYRSKANMIKARGLVLTSIEAISENQDSFTHWTPNVYRYGSYSDSKRQITRGHAEENLRQINTFYIDFDITSSSEEMTSGDILTAAIDLGFMPTLILKSDKGYQAYFVLETPAYVTANSQFRVVKVAKAISQNLRNYFNQTLPVDMTCNHFGIARMPRTDNIEFFHAEYTYSFQEWLDWSMKQSDLPFPSKKPNLTVITGTEGVKQIDEPWYGLLMREANIKGAKALMGRNNVLFTLALANFSSGVSQADCENVLADFNEHLAEPLTQDEFFKVIASAYSGKYEAASRDFVILLCKAWVNENLKASDLFVKQRWYKFKKKRTDRVYSHYTEWETDIMDYITAQTGTDQVVLKVTQKDLQKAIGIASSSLKIVLRRLADHNKIFLQMKKGRGGGLILASVKTVLLSIMQKTKETKTAYFASLARFLEIPGQIIKQTINKA